MAQVETVKETHKSSKTEVLAIGDGEEWPTPREKYSNMSYIYYYEHLRLLFGGIREPIEFSKDWKSMDYFAVGAINQDNHHRRYQFHCSKGFKFPEGAIISGFTYNAQLVMAQVRKRLKREKWISEYVIETPLKTKPKSYCRSDQYIQQIVSESFVAARIQIFKYVIFLHREHMKKL